LTGICKYSFSIVGTESRTSRLQLASLKIKSNQIKSKDNARCDTFLSH